MVHIPPPDEASGSDRHPFGAWWAVALFVVAVALLVLQTRPVIPVFDWAELESPPGPLNLDSIVSTEEGVALLSGVTTGGVILWWRGQGEWEGQLLGASQTQLSSAGSDLVAYRARSGDLLGRKGERWIPVQGLELPAATRSRQASGRPSIFGFEDGLLELSLFGDVWWIGRDDEPRLVVEDPAWGPGVEMPFTSSCRPPARSSPDVPPMASTESGFIAMTSSNRDEPFGIWPVCEPVTWTSDDGIDWSVATTTLGDDGAYVYDLAWKDDTLVAVGGRGIGRPVVWASDDGLDWAEITPDMPDAVDLYRVESGGAGWVVLGRDSLASASVGWASTDASCWEPLPDPIEGTEAAVTRHGIVVIDRTVPRMWLGTPSGSSGACR